MPGATTADFWSHDICLVDPCTTYEHGRAAVGPQQYFPQLPATNNPNTLTWAFSHVQQNLPLSTPR